MNFLHERLLAYSYRSKYHETNILYFCNIYNIEVIDALIVIHYFYIYLKYKCIFLVLLIRDIESRCKA